MVSKAYLELSVCNVCNGALFGKIVHGFILAKILNTPLITFTPPDYYYYVTVMEASRFLSTPKLSGTIWKGKSNDSYGFFLSGSFFTNIHDSQITPVNHFYLLHRLLDISQVIIAEGLHLHMAISRTQAGNLWFPSSSYQPLSSVFCPRIKRFAHYIFFSIFFHMLII